MDVKRRVLAIVASSVLLTGTGCVAPSQFVPTLWQKLGIPQGGVRLTDSLVNRRGNFPGLERKPPLLRIADPANLESPEEMIKVAAEVKKAEDLKKQKIKALKFLGEIGCGCYDKDGAVEGALLDGLDDCTADVRMAAVEAIQTAIGECGCCDSCAVTCCTKKVQEKLADVAYGETEGCWHEPVEEIREAAMAVLCCCPAVQEEAIDNNNGGGNGGGGGENPLTDDDAATETTGFFPGAPTTGPVTSLSDDYYPVNVEQPSVGPQPSLTAPDALVPTVHVEDSVSVSDSSADGDEALITAMIESVDSEDGMILVAFFDSYEIPVGTQMVLVAGDQEIEVAISESSVGRAKTQPAKSSQVEKISAGDMIKVGILAE